MLRRSGLKIVPDDNYTNEYINVVYLQHSPVSPPNTSDEGSCCDTAVTVDDVDAGDDKPTSRAVEQVLGCDWSVGCVEG